MPEEDDQFKEVTDKLNEATTSLDSLLKDPELGRLFQPPPVEVEIEDEQ